jgi:hypothetical protein
MDGQRLPHVFDRDTCITNKVMVEYTSLDTRLIRLLLSHCLYVQSFTLCYQNGVQLIWT